MQIRERYHAVQDVPGHGEFSVGDCMVAEDMDSGYTAATRRIKAYAFTTRSGKNVPQIILQGNWVEQRGFEIGCSVTVECYQNKLVILKD